MILYCFVFNFRLAILGNRPRALALLSKYCQLKFMLVYASLMCAYCKGQYSFREYYFTFRHSGTRDTAPQSRVAFQIPTPGRLKLPATSAPGEYDTSGLHGNLHACKKCIYIIKNNKLIRYSLSRSAYFAKV